MSTHYPNYALPADDRLCASDAAYLRQFITPNCPRGEVMSMKSIPRFYLSPESVAEINRQAHVRYALLRTLRAVRQAREEAAQRRAQRIVIRDFKVITGGQA